MSATAKRIVLLDDPYNDISEPDLEFRLTYAGLLLGESKTDTRARHKHEIRRSLHPQLRHLWSITPQLRTAMVSQKDRGFEIPSFTSRRVQWLASQFQRCGYGFVPLVTEDLALLCGISILFLRPDPPGSLIKSGDIDNRLKTLFDAFRLPKDQGELGGYVSPDENEKPFFCLMEDDRLITKVSVETDVLLESINDPPNPNDCRLVITVSLHRVSGNWANAPFA